MEDREFIMEAAKDGLSELELGKLGVDHAPNREVRQFAERLIEEHEKANRELFDLAKRKNLQVPTSIDQDRQSMLDALRGLSPEDFEREYMKAVMKGHQKSIAVFQQEATTGEDPEVRNFAGKLLPRLQAHFRKAKSLTDW